MNGHKHTRSIHFMDEDKISSKKYKIFFKTLLYGTVEENEISHLWTRLEESLANPFAFDKLIEDIKTDK